MKQIAGSNEYRPRRGPMLIVATITLVVIVFLLWAAGFELDEVAVGPGRVIPSSQTQLVQSMQGGRVIKVLISNGDLVEKGQLLAVLDTSVIESEINEIEAGLADGLAQQRVLVALLDAKTTLNLEGAFTDDTKLVNQKTALFNDMRTTQQSAIAGLSKELELLEEEQAIFERASELGGGTQIERLRLQQKIASVQTRINNQEKNYLSDLRVQLDEVNRNVRQLRIRLSGQKKLLNGMELRSPTRGIVQDVLVSTAGSGVVPPSGTVMEIVPIEDTLQIEARFSPRDIAFIAPGQFARIKVTAYDSSIYGELDAEVLRVSPSSFQDEQNNGAYYFIVTLKSDLTYFETEDGRKHQIIPGMVTTAEILTGRRTILQYILKPLRKAGEALRER